MNLTPTTVIFLGAIAFFVLALAYHGHRARKNKRPPTRAEVVEQAIALLDKRIFDRKLEDIRIAHERAGLVQQREFLQDEGADQQEADTQPGAVLVFNPIASAKEQIA